MTDTHAATELEQYIVNEAGLHGQHMSILKNLATKKARGVYKHDLAVKLFGYLVQAGAKKYADAFEPTLRVWHQMFDVPTRRAVAEALTNSFEEEQALGNYDDLLPKKYQKKSQKQEKVPRASGSQHATKKIAWKTPESIKITWSPVNQAYFALWPSRGRVQDQQVLKIASAEDMHGWLRDTYGPEYGIASRASSRAHASCKRCRGGGCSSCGTTSHRSGRRSPAQLDRDIASALSSHRGGR